MLLTQDIKVTAETAGRTKGRILLKACCDVCKRLVAVLSWLHLVTFVKLNIDAAHAARRTTIGCRLMCSGKEPSCADIEIFVVIPAQAYAFFCLIVLCLRTSTCRMIWSRLSHPSPNDGSSVISAYRSRRQQGSLICARIPIPAFTIAAA